MTGVAAPDNPGFLSGAGAMGKLIASFDWSTTALGPIETWSATLKASLGLMLRSAVPMVMLCGPTGVLIYNEGYARFAGGRHPHILGATALEAWPEIAAFNADVLKRGFAGETFGFVEQELLLAREGSPEQVWLDLDYSPVPDETGKIIAIIAIVVETTNAVRAARWAADERGRMRAMFEQAPGFIAMLSGPSHVFDLTNIAYMQLIGHRKVIGKTVREALPEIEGQGFYELLDGVYSSGEAFVGRGLKVFLQRTPSAAPEERYVDLIYQPVRDPGGAVVGIFVEGADVTEREVAERTVRQNAEQFRLFAEAMPNHVWTAAPNGQLDWFNSRVYEYAGAAAGALDGDAWATIIHPDDIAVAAPRWAASIASGVPYETEFRVRRSDGAYRWHISRAVAIRDDSGAIVRWIGTNTDIDEQKQAQHDLSESEARLKLAIEAGNLAVWELDTARNYITPSVALNRLYGFADDSQPTLAEYQSRYAPGEAERLAVLGETAAARGETGFEAEIRHLLPGGLERWFLVRAQSVDDGKRAIGVVIDVTERRRVEAELVASELRFRLSQNAAGIASLELDIPSGTVVGSDGFWDLWGLAPRDSIHISALETIVLPDDGKIRSTAETRQAGTAAPNVEYRIKRADTGEIRWLSRNIEFLRDVDGTPLKMFGIMQDITDRKEAEARQEMLTHELEHRIKNILAMVAAIASQTLRNTDLETARAAFNDRLRALASAHDILTRTRWTAASLAEVVKAAVAPLPTARIGVHGPAIAIPPKMALSLALAVNELGTNALKYGALSGDEGRVDVSWSIAPGDDGTSELTWVWRESGGPVVQPPERKGFGRFLLERVLAADFNGTVRIEYPPHGVECFLIAPAPDRPASN